MNNTISAAKLVAPISSYPDAEKLIEVGADELYCGAMFNDWVRKYSDSDLISRRQGKSSHIGQVDELSKIVKLTSDSGKTISLALNARYSKRQMPIVLDILRLWEDIGGRSVIVNDIGVILALKDYGSALRIHLSTLAGIFNFSSVEFFVKLGIKRFILPRDLLVEEIRSIIKTHEDIEYETLVMNQKCQYIDGMCGFYHGVMLPEDKPAEFDYHYVPDNDLPITYSHDPEYEGHGCRLNWQCDGNRVRNIECNDFAAPHCAACMLASLFRAGVRHFKVAGRGYPLDKILRCVKFLRLCIGIWSDHSVSKEAAEYICKQYERTFDAQCNSSLCYYKT